MSTYIFWVGRKSETFDELKSVEQLNDTDEKSHWLSAVMFIVELLSQCFRSDGYTSFGFWLFSMMFYSKQKG